MANFSSLLLRLVLERRSNLIRRGSLGACFLQAVMVSSVGHTLRQTPVWSRARNFWWKSAKWTVRESFFQGSAFSKMMYVFLDTFSFRFSFRPFCNRSYWIFDFSLCELSAMLAEDRNYGRRRPKVQTCETWRRLLDVKTIVHLLPLVEWFFQGRAYSFHYCQV